MVKKTIRNKIKGEGWAVAKLDKARAERAVSNGWEYCSDWFWDNGEQTSAPEAKFISFEAVQDKENGQ